MPTLSTSETDCRSKLKGDPRSKKPPRPMLATWPLSNYCGEAHESWLSDAEYLSKLELLPRQGILDLKRLASLNLLIILLMAGVYLDSRRSSQWQRGTKTARAHLDIRRSSNIQDCI